MGPRILLLSVALALAAGPLPAGAADRLDELVEIERGKQKIPGVGVAIVRGGEPLKLQGYGLANVEHRVSVSPETTFQSGSVGKQFTAVAVMLQVEAGTLALDDPIARFFPGAPAAWKRITVRHLLTHTSGIADYGSASVDYRKDYSDDEFARMAFGLAAGYRLVDGALQNQEWVSPQLNTMADSSLYLSLRDLVAWDRGLRAGAVLKPESWNEVYAPVALTSGKTYPYGFGWKLDEVAGQKVRRHGGSWQGFKSDIARFLGSDLTVIVLANLAQARPERFTDALAGAVDPTLAAAMSR
jgi:hypothetical protein